MIARVLLVTLFASLCVCDISDWLGLDDPNSFRCSQSRKLIPLSYLNDNFCDCIEDGSDEPETDACANGKFVCDSIDPSLEKQIFSSQVNDNICDCCDGTDENKPALCPNKCSDALVQILAEREELARIFTNGKEVRQAWIQEGKKAKEKRMQEIEEMKESLEALDARKEALLENKAKEEALEEEEKAQLKISHLNALKEKLQLDTHPLTTLHSLLAFLASSSSKAAETAIACATPFLPDGVDDVTVISAAVEVEGGFLNTDLDSLKGTLASERRRLQRETRKLNDLESRIERLKEKEEEDKKEEEVATATKSKAAILAEKLKRLKDRDRILRSKIDDETLNALDDDDGDDFPSTYGVLQDDPIEDASDAAGLETQLETARAEVQAVTSTVADLEKAVEEKEGAAEEEERKWRREKAAEASVALGLDHVDDVAAAVECVYAIVNDASKGKLLVQVANDEFSLGLPADTPTPDDVASHVRSEAEEARRDLVEIDEEIDDGTRDLTKLQDENEYDFGEEEEFHALYGKCFDISHDKYKYSFCPFKEAKQDFTLLGHMDADAWKEDKTKMHFNGGQWCMDKDRKAVVRFECGSESQVMRVSEPERCEYDMIFRTPAVCVEKN